MHIRRSPLFVFMAYAVLWTGLGSIGLQAQTIARQSQTSTQATSMPSAPHVQPDGRVTFVFPAMIANNMELQLEGYGKPLPMQRQIDGQWTVTVGPLEPGIYSYVFLSNDVPLLDPANTRLNPNLRWPSNFFEVPGAAPQLWDVQDVPHGVLHHHFYTSRVAGDRRDYFVYTPPGYDPQSGQKYPVLYLLHGYSDDASAWVAVGRANTILDNLLAQHRMVPMIVVMPLGYGDMRIVTGSDGLFENRALRERNFNLFTQALLTEVIPRVQAEYRTQTGREDRAIAGLSMGGAESLLTGLNHLDTFAWVGSFSAGGLDRDFATDFPALTAQNAASLRLLWIACGQDDRYIGSSPLITLNRDLVQWLQNEKIPVTWVETPGMHQWGVWRNNLIHFAPLLFQPK